MTFKDLDLPLSINTTKANPVTKFFIPVLCDAVNYDVAVGFFTTAWVRDAAEGIAQFACNGGKARWIISPVLSTDDYEALKSASGGLSHEKIERKISLCFEALFADLKANTRTVFGWLIRDGILEVRIGVPENELSGMLHAKMGVFRDAESNRIGFSGSYNLTKGAATNWEKIEIYCDWKSDESQARIDEIQQEIDEMWDGDDKNLAIFKPSDEALKPFLREAERTERPYAVPPHRQRYSPPVRFLENGELRPYQTNAIKEWFANNGRGIFSMATGSGKTVTALSAASRLANYIVEGQHELLIVITVPYQHLADQWVSETKAFGFSPVACYGGTDRWITQAQSRMTALASGSDHIVVLIAVNDTFSGAPFQAVISGRNRNVLFIADEMHNLGAPSFLEALPEHAKFRLGLSATPIRHGDEEGTRALEDYFGPVVSEFSLADAIKHKFLCPYFYHPILCPLNEQEMAEYKDLSAQIAQAYAGRGDEDEPSSFLQKLLIARARLISRLESKLTNLRAQIGHRTTSSYNLVYCGDARDAGERQVDKVLHLVGYELNMRAAKFTSEQDAGERRDLLERFSNETLQALVAIRCLDEGVDVPKTETAYILASSTNPRQYIQRRGRVLRKAPGKTTANIYDFIAVPNLDELASTHPTALETERRLVRKELERIAEFAQLALNAGEALSQLRELKMRLHLTDY